MPAPVPSTLSTTSSPISTALNRAGDAQMSSRWSSSSSASGGTLALSAAACVPASSSARSSLRVISTSEPSPSLVLIGRSK